jgi:hypothetical protein
VGCHMNRIKALSFLTVLLLVAVSLSSCSGPKPGTVIPGGGGGSVTLNVTASATPDSVPGTIPILSFTANISGISITAGSTPFTITPSNPNVDLNKLLSDSVFLGQASPGSNFLTESQITIASAKVVYCVSTAGTAGCNAGSIQTVTSSGAQTITDNALPTFPNGATNLGMRLQFQLQNALVLNGAGTAVTKIDFTQALALEWVALPQSSNLSATQLDYIEDITGVVTAASSTSVTIQSATAGTFTAAIVSGTSDLVATPVVGQVGDMDVILNDDGTSTLLVYDEIATSSIDVVEGVIGYIPSLGNQFQFVVTNFQPASAGSLINTNLHLGDLVTVNISGGTAFTVDIKNLAVNTGNNFSNASDTSIMTPGQVVAVSPTAFTAANGATPASVTVNGLMLRYSRLAGLPTTAGPNFPFLPVEPYFGIQIAAQTFETNGATNSEVNGGTVTANTLAAIRALYFGPASSPTFYIAKVRQ